MNIYLDDDQQYTVFLDWDTVTIECDFDGLTMHLSESAFQQLVQMYHEDEDS